MICVCQIPDPQYLIITVPVMNLDKPNFVKLDNGSQFLPVSTPALKIFLTTEVVKSDLKIIILLC